VNALAAKGHAEALRVETQALLANAEAQLAREKAMLTGVSSPQAREFAMQDMANAQEAVNRIRASLGETDKAIAQAETQIADATARVYQDAVLRDPVDKIKHHYQQLIDQARERGLAEHKTFVEIAKQTEALKLQRDAAIKAEQDKDRKGPANAGGTAIFNEQIASFFDIAARYRGMSETKDRLTLKTFLGDVDPEKTAWCAAFVNAVLPPAGFTAPAAWPRHRSSTSARMTRAARRRATSRSSSRRAARRASMSASSSRSTRPATSPCWAATPATRSAPPCSALKTCWRSGGRRRRRNPPRPTTRPPALRCRRRIRSTASARA
jgi:hypothetical protein